MCEKNRNNKPMEIEQFDRFVEWIQTRVAFGWLSKRSALKTSCSKNFLENYQSILCFDVILQHDWPIKLVMPSHVRVFCGGKTKSSCFDLFLHWLIKQITNHFSRSYENRSVLSNGDDHPCDSSPD